MMRNLRGPGYIPLNICHSYTRCAVADAGVAVGVGPLADRPVHGGYDA